MQYILATYALEKSDRLFINSMLGMANKKFGLQWRLDDNNGQATVVDVETPEGRTFWQTNQAHKTLIAYAQTNTYRATYFLEKPLKVQQVTELLKSLADNLSPASASNAVSPNASSQNNPAGLAHYQPNDFLGGLLKKILAVEQPYTLQLAGTPPLHVIPEDKQCYSVEMDLFEPNPIQKMWFKSPADQFQKQPIETARLTLIREEFTSYPIDTFLWLSTLNSSNGSLLVGHNLPTPVRLKEYPNFSILPYESFQMQLAAFMLKNTASIPRIAANTRQSMPAVINFYNACAMLELVLIEKTAKEIPETTKTLSSDKKNLLKNIFQRLMG
ncbi:MAG: hypothetical protein RIT27_2372 [Pseudomonadota bacterium]|jgi:hypothetical protein